MPLKILPASGSGSATLVSVAGTTTNDTLTLPARTGNIITSADTGTVTQAMLASNVAGNGPAFSAYRATSNQTGISSTTATKIQLNAKNFDAGSNFDASTNYRFTPPVNGYYQFSFAAYLSGTAVAYASARLHKNGNTELAYGNNTAYNPNEWNSAGSALVYLTTSEYVELFAFAIPSSGSITVSWGNAVTYLTGFLARAA